MPEEMTFSSDGPGVFQHMVVFDPFNPVTREGALQYENDLELTQSALLLP